MRPRPLLLVLPLLLLLTCVALPSRTSTDRGPLTLHSLRRVRDYVARRKAAARLDGRPAGTGFLESFLYRMEQRAFPFDSFDSSIYERAIAHRERMSPAVLEAGSGSDTQATVRRWVHMGPTNLEVPSRTYFGTSALSGRVNALAYHPKERGTFFLGAATGGVWKTTDAGASWVPLSDRWKHLQISSLAIEPQLTAARVKRALYVGTGDFPGYGLMGHSFHGFGIMKSLDDGQTFKHLKATEKFGNAAVSRIVIYPESPQYLIATTGRGAQIQPPGEPVTYGEGGLWISRDAGESWKVVSWPSHDLARAEWCDAAVGAISNDGRYRRWLYAVGYVNERGGPGVPVRRGLVMVRSLDRGRTWTQLTLPPLRIEPSPSVNHLALAVATSPTDSDRVYLLAPTSRQVFRSENGGRTWLDITAGFPHGDANYNWSQGGYDYAIGCSTQEGRDLLYVGLIDLARWSDQPGGGVWESVGGPSYTESARIHNDQHCIAVNPRNPNDLLIGNDGGVYRYFPGRTEPWVGLNGALGITQFYRMDAHPRDRDRVIGGTQDNATPYSPGTLSDWKNTGGGDGGFCAINPADPEIQYATAGVADALWISRTGDGWVSRDDVSPRLSATETPAFLPPINLDPWSPNRLFAASNWLWMRDDTAEEPWTAWAEESSRIADGYPGWKDYGTYLTATACGSPVYTGALSGEVNMVEFDPCIPDATPRFTEIQDGSPGLPVRTVTGIAVHPYDPYHLFVVVSGSGSGHVWRCRDTRASPRIWTDVSGRPGPGRLPDAPANAVAIDPRDPDSTWYVATDVGAFITQDAGRTWADLHRGRKLPNVQVMDLKLVPSTGHLYAATWGRGMWRLKLTGATVGEHGYDVLPLGTLGEPGNTDATALNALGRVVGESGVGGVRRAFRTGPEMPIRPGVDNLDTRADSYNSVARAINSGGKVVGRWTTSTTFVPRGFLYENGVMKDLGTLGWDDCEAAGINRRGDVCGSSMPVVGELKRHAFLKPAGSSQLIDLGTLPGTDESFGTAINDQSVIVGYTGGRGSGAHKAFVFCGSMEELPVPPGFYSPEPRAINAAGVIVGSARKEQPGTDPRIAVMWYRGQFRELGSLGGDTQALSLNSQGVVVGVSSLRAFIWDPVKGMRDLNGQLGQTPPWILRDAVGINDRGQIAANRMYADGSGLDPALLTPR